MALYLEASKVAAHLATKGADPDKWRDRFFELYWGELGFVESQYKPTERDKSIEELMVSVCHANGFPECQSDAPGAAAKTDALTLARQAAAKTDALTLARQGRDVR